MLQTSTGEHRAGLKERHLAGRCLLLQRHGQLSRRRSCHGQKPSVIADTDTNFSVSALRVVAAVLPQLENQRSVVVSSAPSGWKRGNRTQSGRCLSPVVAVGDSGVTAIKMVEESVWNTVAAGNFCLANRAVSTGLCERGTSAGCKVGLFGDNISRTPQNHTARIHAPASQERGSLGK